MTATYPKQIRSRDTNGQPIVLAEAYARDTAYCDTCGNRLQRTHAGTLRDGIRAHYRVVHPEKLP
jgi:hypothetical protein